MDGRMDGRMGMAPPDPFRKPEGGRLVAIQGAPPVLPAPGSSRLGLPALPPVFTTHASACAIVACLVQFGAAVEPAYEGA